MKYSIAAAAFAFAASVSAQGGELNLKPEEPNPEGCQDTLDYNFSFNTIAVGPREGTSAGNPPSKRNLILEARQSQQTLDCSKTTLMLSLSDGTLLDNRTEDQGGPRIGSVVANDQFQFDGAPGPGQPIRPQAGAKYTAGWCVLQNGTLTLGGSSLFYNCNSGSFDNIYFARIAEEGCQPVRLDTGRCSGKPYIHTLDGAQSGSSSGSGSSSSPATSSQAASSTSHPTEHIATEMPSAPAGMFSTFSQAPAPVGTAPPGTASRGIPPSPTGSPTSSPSPFVGAASALEAGQKILAAAAFGAAALLF